MPHLDFPQSACRAGVARADITPPVGIYHRMWGAATHDRSTGVHRPLLATAVALAPASADGGATADGVPQVIVGIDHCLLWTEEMETLRAAVAAAAGLRVESVHIACSHTHAAGLMDPARAEFPGGELIAPYLELLAQRAGEAARDALKRVRPATVLYGHARCGLAHHRDFWDEANGLFACGLNPSGPADDAVLVARVVDEHGTTITSMVNYACHPTTLAWDNTLISPDYVGAMREVVESATGAPCLFLQGASGDLGPREGYVGDTAVADRNGRQLGFAALSALESLPPPRSRYEYAGPVVSGATIGTWQYRELPAETACETFRWRTETFRIELPYRPGLPTRQATEIELSDWEQKRDQAEAAGDHATARDCSAQAERSRRLLTRLRSLPSGASVPLTVSLWQLGGAYWVLLEGEHYQLLQRELRRRFEGHPIVVATVADGWRPGYLPTRETYDRGIYQESIAVVAPGSLETVIDAISDRLQTWGAARSAA